MQIADCSLWNAENASYAECQLHSNLKNFLITQKEKCMNLPVDRNIKNIHMIAICGTAMGALAGMLIERGYSVTGSDEGIYPPMCDYLRALGIDIMPGFKSENLDVNPDLVIVGNTVKRINPEAQAVVERGIPYMHLPQAIREFFIRDRHSVVIAGTHGKTTTTSLTTWVFETAGRNPGFLVGGVMKNFNSNAKAGAGDYFIIEGDEYDSAYFDKVPKCWHYLPQTAAITSVEFDHGDIYRDIDHVKEAFGKFASIIPVDGLLIACADFPHVFDVIKQASCRVLTYGFNENADIQIRDLVLNEKGGKFRIVMPDEIAYEFHTPMWGRHNASNAVVAAITGLHHGIPQHQIQEAFNTFTGIKRRQEVIYDKHDILIIDDFAHHPTKVRETVKAVRSRFPQRRVISVFEPRTNTSRRKFFQDLYPESFQGSDLVIVAGVFNTQQLQQNEPDNIMDPVKLVADINNQAVNAVYIPNTDRIVSHLGDTVQPGDVILIMSNGGFDGIYKKLPDVINSKLCTGRDSQLCVQ
jgi:UDP-N-acetylmuramate: L-alanyl-gamma-D-glutamyl-meso-diaminopimelate ligase